MQELSASLVWSSGDWNGDAVTCESTSAGTVRQRNPTIETSYADRREAQEDGTDDVIPEAHGDAADDTTENVKDTDVREYHVGAGGVDAADVSDKEVKGLKRRGEQFLEVRKALEIHGRYLDCPRERTCSCELSGRELSAWVSREHALTSPLAKESASRLAERGSH